MSYHFFGNFHGKPAEEVIKEAKQQKQAEDVVSAVLSPVSFVAKKGVKAVTGKTPGIVSDEQFVKAIILKTLKDNDLAPNSRFERKVRAIVEQILDEKKPYPQWKSVLPSKK